MRQTRFYTIGYAGLTTERFVGALLAAGVRVLVDIRQMPLSRKAGFSKTALRELLKRHDVDYVHFQALGVPRRLRQSLGYGLDLEQYLQEFRAHLATCSAELDSLAALAQKKRCCLMCVEHDVDECHRSVVAAELVGRHRAALRAEHL